MGDPRLSSSTWLKYRATLAEFDFPRLQGLHIDGVEVTQGIQYYHAEDHLTDPSDRGSDNSVTMVAGKPAWIRVYVRSGLLGSDIANVTGQVEVLRRRDGFLYDSIVTLNPQPPGVVTAQRTQTYDTERTSLNLSLNFVTPPPNAFLQRTEVMCGVLKLKVTITAPTGASDTAEVDLDVTLQQSLRLRGIMVGYNGPASSAQNAPNLILGAPTLANLQNTAGWALLTYPVRSIAGFSTGGSITLTTHLQDAQLPNGGCSNNWLALNSKVQAQVVSDGNKSGWLYYGLLASGIPMGPVVGCESGGVSSGQVGAAVTLAHEVGHRCGLQHGPCGSVGTSADPNYPAYEPYDATNTPQASIGEYGLDVSTGNIFSPKTYKDMMSYCGPNWISLYHYGRLLNNDALNPQQVCHDEPWWNNYSQYDPWWWLPWRYIPDPPPPGVTVTNPEQIISIIGIAHSADELEITSVMRVEAFTNARNATASEFIAELRGAEGNVIAYAPVHSLAGQAHGGCGCASGGTTAPQYPFVFQAFVPDVAGGSSLVIRRGRTEVWTRHAAETMPRVKGFRAELEGDRLELAWEGASGSKQEAEIWVQYSQDEGKRWHGLTTGLRGHHATVELAGLPHGPLELRLLFSDGFHTAHSERVSIRVPHRAPHISVLMPRNGQALVVPGTMRLWGVANTGDGRNLPDETAVWFLDGKELARGFDHFIETPQAGEHRLLLVVQAEGSPAAEVEVTFKTVAIGAKKRHTQ